MRRPNWNGQYGRPWTEPERRIGRIIGDVILVLAGLTLGLLLR